MIRLLPLLIFAAAAFGQIVDPVKHLPGPPRQPTQSSGEAIKPQPTTVAPVNEAPKPVAPTMPGSPQTVQPNRLNPLSLSQPGPAASAATITTNTGPWATTALPNHWQPAKPASANPWETKPAASPWK